MRRLRRNHAKEDLVVKVTVKTDSETFTYEQCDEPWCIAGPHPGDPWHVDVTGHTWSDNDESGS